MPRDRAFLTRFRLPNHCLPRIASGAGLRLKLLRTPGLLQFHAMLKPCSPTTRQSRRRRSCFAIGRSSFAIDRLLHCRGLVGVRSLCRLSAGGNPSLAPVRARCAHGGSQPGNKSPPRDLVLHQLTQIYANSDAGTRDEQPNQRRFRTDRSPDLALDLRCRGRTAAAKHASRKPSSRPICSAWWMNCAGATTTGIKARSESRFHR